jgi:hypothetical protein
MFLVVRIGKDGRTVYALSLELSAKHARNPMPLGMGRKARST